MGSVNGLDASEIFEGQALLYMNMFGFLQTMSLKWAMQQGIADIIYNHGKPITFPELVSALQVPAAKTSLVKRLMRFLSHNGIFASNASPNIHPGEEKEDEDHDAFDLTPASKLLISKAARAGRSNPCLAPIIRMSTDPLLINKFHQLGEFLSGDLETLYEVAYGKPVWGFLKDNPAYQGIFNEAMASDSQLVHLALKNCSSVFEGLDTLVDVGGGTGTTARSIIEAFPKLKIVVYDLPQVVGNLSSGSNNLSYVGGDMFKSIPEADAVLLKWVLHDWSDEVCIQILKNCKDSVSRNGKRGKVIIMDVMINEKEDTQVMTQTKLCLDLIMMGINGKERTGKEWKQLIKEAGFKDYKIFPFFGLRSLIEVYP